MARTESKTFSLFSVNNLSDKHSPPAPLCPHHLWTLLESACTLWLICGSFVHWLRCNCCSLAAQAPILFICTVGWGESELNVEGPGLYRENRKIPRADVGRPTSLIRQWPVPEVWCGFWITGITQGSVSAVLDWKYEWTLSQGRAEQKRKQEEHLERFTGGERGAGCQNSGFKGRGFRKEKETVCLPNLKDWWWQTEILEALIAGAPKLFLKVDVRG